MPAMRRVGTDVAVALALAACAQLPQNVPRPESAALASPAGTALGELVQAQRGAAPATSGFVLLDGPQAAYGGRLALIDATQKTLDLQYYASLREGAWHVEQAKGGGLV